MRNRLTQHWHPETLFNRLRLSQSQKSWLLETQSLTAKFRQTCPHLQVEVLSEKWERPSTQEAIALNLPLNEWAWVRCIVLKCDELPLLYARTIIPACLPKNPWFALKSLGSRPLGEVLFTLKNRQRSAFVLSRMSTSLPYFSPSKPPSDDYLARQSCFYQGSFPLLLTEVFLDPL
jgi:chorismate--pyruvate lyase